MRRFVLVLVAAAALWPPGRAAAQRVASTRAARLTDEEQAFCASEIEVLEKRRKIFEAQKLSPAEIAKKNQIAEQSLAECRARLRSEARRAGEHAEDERELQRRAGENATENERAKIWAEIRRDRLIVKNAADLTPAERAELAAGLQDEAAETHQTLDTVHSRSPVFMRQVHSALACYHGDRKEELTAGIDEETAHLKLGSGDRQRLYVLRNELKQSEEVLARAKEAARGYVGGLIRCNDQRTAILARCLAIRFEGKPYEPACDAEEIQQYIRFIN